ncbi:MAG: hypothetical protein HQK54_18125 [Oligoflexales bacterium]|nr:hypothetical protein [Oligoflexales bacterium]
MARILLVCFILVFSCRVGKDKKKNGNPSEGSSYTTVSSESLENEKLAFSSTLLQPNTLSRLKDPTSWWTCDDKTQICTYRGNERRVFLKLEESECVAISGSKAATRFKKDGPWCELSHLPARFENAAQGITVKIPVKSDLFDGNSMVHLSIFNQEDIDISGRNGQKYGQCDIVYDYDSETESIVCPNGIKWNPEPDNSESYQINASQITAGEWTITTGHLKKGQKYIIDIIGQNSDKCNTSEAFAEGSVDADVLQLKDLKWDTTLKACNSIK